jgi:hypothetical protein
MTVDLTVDNVTGDFGLSIHSQAFTLVIFDWFFTEASLALLLSQFEKNWLLKRQKGQFQVASGLYFPSCSSIDHQLHITITHYSTFYSSPQQQHNHAWHLF